MSATLLSSLLTLMQSSQQFCEVDTVTSILEKGNKGTLELSLLGHTNEKVAELKFEPNQAFRL